MRDSESKFDEAASRRDVLAVGVGAVASGVLISTAQRAWKPPSPLDPSGFDSIPLSTDSSRVLVELNKLPQGADATVVINRALAGMGAEGGNLLLPQGEFLLMSGPVQVSQSNLILRGSGQGRTKLTVGGDFPAISIKPAATEQLENVRLSNISVVGNRSSGNQQCVHAEGVRGLTIDDVLLADAGNNGLNIFSCHDGEIRRVAISGARDFGVLVYQSSNIRLFHTRVTDLDQPDRAHIGIQFKSSTRCAAIDPHISNVYGYGIYTWSDGSRPDTNHLILNADISGSRNGVFAGIGIYLNEGDGHRVVSPDVQDSDSTGISLNRASRVQIVGPRVSAVTSSGGAAIEISGQSNGTSVLGGCLSGHSQGVVLNGVERCSLIGVEVSDMASSSSNEAAAFHLLNGARKNRVLGVSAIDDRPEPRMPRGIYEETDCSDNHWASCLVSGAVISDLAVLGRGSTALLSITGDRPSSAPQLDTLATGEDAEIINALVDSLRRQGLLGQTR